MKRWSIIIALVALFFVFTGGLTSCGAATEGLENSVGTGDGPGSGNWNPALPDNIRQARRLYNVLQTLAENANEASVGYDKLYVECLDENGNVRPGQDESCIQTLVESAGTVDRLFTDFFTGGTVYLTWAQENEEEDPPKPPNPPDPPDNDPPKTEGPEDNDDPFPCPPYCCLTCTHNLDVEHVYFPRPIEIELPSS